MPTTKQQDERTCLDLQHRWRLCLFSAAFTPAPGTIQPATHWVSYLTTDLKLLLCLHTWTYTSPSLPLHGVVFNWFHWQIYLYLGYLNTTLTNSDCSAVHRCGGVFIFFCQETLDLMKLTMKCTSLCSSPVLHTVTHHLDWCHRKKLHGFKFPMSCYISPFQLSSHSAHRNVG
jgi:hypothetical protein